MRKKIGILLAALLCVLCAFAAAEAPAMDESVIADFEHTWINRDNPDDTVEIWFDGENWQVSAVRIEGDDVYSTEFSGVFYYEEYNLLLCVDGLQVRGLFLANGTKDTWTVLGEKVAEHFNVMLRMDEEGQLWWSDFDNLESYRIYVIGEDSEEEPAEDNQQG